VRDSGIIFFIRSVGCRVETGTEHGILYTHDMHVMALQTEKRHLCLIIHTCPAVLVHFEIPPA